jgi:phage-related minor tail protein
MADEFTATDEIERAYDRIAERQLELEKNAERFSVSMSGAFARSVTSGRTFEDTLRNLALRMSDIALRAAFKPIASSLTDGLSGLFGSLFNAGGGMQAATGAVKPFATGGVIGTPTYFPLSSGGLGLAGEAGPEAILPLARGPDGRLGVSASGGGVTNVVVQIATPDPGSFRRAEAYLTGQIARAVARGQRSL